MPATRPRGSTAGSGAIWHLQVNALRPAGWTSADAAGLPILPGLLSYAQVQAAVRRPADHPRDPLHRRSGPGRPSSGRPGTRRAPAPAPRLPPMGARFRLRAGFTVGRFCASRRNRYCRDAKAILVEMQHYGLILADNGSNWYFQGSAFPQWPDGLVALLKRHPGRGVPGGQRVLPDGEPQLRSGQGRPGCPIG